MPNDKRPNIDKASEYKGEYEFIVFNMGGMISANFAQMYFYY